MTHGQVKAEGAVRAGLLSGDTGLKVRGERCGEDSDAGKGECVVGTAVMTSFSEGRQNNWSLSRGPSFNFFTFYKQITDNV